MALSDLVDQTTPLRGCKYNERTQLSISWWIAVRDKGRGSGRTEGTWDTKTLNSQIST